MGLNRQNQRKRKLRKNFRRKNLKKRKVNAQMTLTNKTRPKIIPNEAKNQAPTRPNQAKNQAKLVPEMLGSLPLCINFLQSRHICTVCCCAFVRKYSTYEY